MAFSPRNIVGCLLKKGLQRGGGGHGHPRTPLATPLDVCIRNITSRKQFIGKVQQKLLKQNAALEHFKS